MDSAVIAKESDLRCRGAGLACSTELQLFPWRFSVKNWELYSVLFSSEFLYFGTYLRRVGADFLGVITVNFRGQMSERPCHERPTR